jgi:hypothetical protein
MKSIDRHSQYLDLIPAYLRRQLTAIQTAETELHFQQCTECASELRYARRLHEHFQRQVGGEKLLDNIDQQLDAEADWLSPVREQQNFERLWSRIEYNAMTTSKLSRRWLLPAALAATLLLAIGLPWYQKSKAPDYRTLADSNSHIVCGQLRIRFSDNFPTADIQNLLQSVDAHIVDGPTPHGVYTLRTTNSITSATRALHLHPAVVLVEPTDC